MNSVKTQWHWNRLVVLKACSRRREKNVRVHWHLTATMSFFLSSCANSYIGDNANHLWQHANSQKSMSLSPSANGSSPKLHMINVSWIKKIYGYRAETPKCSITSESEKRQQLRFDRLANRRTAELQNGKKTPTNCHGHQKCGDSGKVKWTYEKMS